MRQIFGEIRWEVKALIFMGLVLSFTLFGPFGTYDDLTGPVRLVYWTGIMFFVAFFLHVAIHLALTTQWLARLRPVVRVWIGVAIGAIPSAAMVSFIDFMFRGSEIGYDDLFRIWWQVTLIAGFIGPLEYIDFRSSGAVPAVLRTRFHDRLPARLGTEIVSLSMQDHYVEVTTTKGRDLILIRLRDAMDELKGLDGLQIHRSHWTAKGHLGSLERDGTRHFVRLSDGRKLPVSATFLPAVEAALTGQRR